MTARTAATLIGAAIFTACASLAAYGIYIMLAEPVTALQALHTMGVGG